MLRASTVSAVSRSERPDHQQVDDLVGEQQQVSRDPSAQLRPQPAPMSALLGPRPTHLTRENHWCTGMNRNEHPVRLVTSAIVTASTALSAFRLHPPRPH